MSENTNSTSSKYTNLEPNMAAALSYILTPFTGIAFYIIEKEDKFVRFHAFQSILFGIASTVIWMITTSLVVLIIGAVLMPFVSLGLFAAYLFLMWKAYNHQEYELPVIGKFAKEHINK